MLLIKIEKRGVDVVGVKLITQATSQSCLNYLVLGGICMGVHFTLCRSIKMESNLTSTNSSEAVFLAAREVCWDAVNNWRI
jgi:hypothetical protein